MSHFDERSPPAVVATSLRSPQFLKGGIVFQSLLHFDKLLVGNNGEFLLPGFFDDLRSHGFLAISVAAMENTIDLDSIFFEFKDRTTDYTNGTDTTQP